MSFFIFKIHIQCGNPINTNIAFCLGCTSYVEIDPLMDDDRTYNDNEWHYLRVMRDNEYSMIQIDNKYQGLKGMQFAVTH